MQRAFLVSAASTLPLAQNNPCAQKGVILGLHVLVTFQQYEDKRPFQASQGLPWLSKCSIQSQPLLISHSQGAGAGGGGRNGVETAERTGPGPRAPSQLAGGLEACVWLSAACTGPENGTARRGGSWSLWGRFCSHQYFVLVYSLRSLLVYTAEFTFGCSPAFTHSPWLHSAKLRGKEFKQGGPPGGGGHCILKITE